jgi:hypothetical protein
MYSIFSLSILPVYFILYPLHTLFHVNFLLVNFSRQAEGFTLGQHTKLGLTFKATCSIQGKPDTVRELQLELGYKWFINSFASVVYD